MTKLNTKTVIGVVSSLAVVALFFWYGVPGSNQGSEAEQRSVPNQEQLAFVREAFDKLAPTDSDYKEVVPGLKVFELAAGTGVKVEKDKSIAIHYIARFKDGVQFDNSVDRGQPLLFVYGQNQLIPGIEQGLEGARAGSVRRIEVPPELAYGKDGVVLEDGTVVIPPNATLIFDVAVINVEE